LWTRFYIFGWVSKDEKIAKEPIGNYELLDVQGSYSYFDYLKWQFKERVELIKGKVFKMSPAPSTNHQVISLNLTSQMLQYFENSSCSMFYAPFDVRLPIPNSKIPNTVVQPDFCVVCDQTKLDKRGCNGVPDLIVEILSENNSKHDLKIKFELYQEVQLPEYWIIDPTNKVVTTYSITNGGFVASKPVAADEDYVESNVFPNLKIQHSSLFKNLLLD
jgi:Uma2 family endonuclease